MVGWGEKAFLAGKENLFPRLWRVEVSYVPQKKKIILKEKQYSYLELIGFGLGLSKVILDSQVHLPTTQHSPDFCSHWVFSESANSF